MTLVYSKPSGSTSWNSLPLFPGATINVVMHGDSMTLGGGVLIPMVQRVAALIVSNGKGTPSWFKEGINGGSWNFAWPSAGYASTMIQDLPLRVTPKKSGTLPNWLILLAGTNGIYLQNHSAATEYADFQTYLAASIAAGFPAANTIVCTMLPRTPGSFGDLESVRTTYNTSLVNGASAGYKLARFDQDANMGQAGQYSNTTYYQADGVHPNDTGAAVLASIVYTAMGL